MAKTRLSAFFSVKPILDGRFTKKMLAIKPSSAVRDSAEARQRNRNRAAMHAGIYPGRSASRNEEIAISFGRKAPLHWGWMGFSAFVEFVAKLAASPQGMGDSQESC